MRRALVFATFLTVVVTALWLTGLTSLAQAWLVMQTQRSHWQERGLWLPDYLVTLDAVPLVGLSENVSGLTWSSETGSLFIVTNRPPAIAELSAEGQVKRLIPLTGTEDPEGITHVEGHRFIIADEGQHRLSWVVITPETRAVDVSQAPHLVLELGAYDNMGFVGVSWDAGNSQLLVAQEMMPVRMPILSGLGGPPDHSLMSLGIREWAPAMGRGFLAADISSLTLHEATGNLLLLSHMNATLFEYAPDGQIVSFLPLWAGNAGLAADIPQAEGVAIGDHGELYIVSEPNLFYRFDRQRPAVWLHPT